MRTSHLLAVLSLSTALVTASPAFAAFEFLNKAQPKTNTAPVVTTKPTTVPVTQTTMDDMPISDMAKAPAEVPVWTPQPLPVTSKTIDVKNDAAPISNSKTIPLTPIVTASDSLQMIDGPLLPDDMPAPIAEPTTLKPISNVAAVGETKNGTVVPTAKRQVLASSTGSALDMENPVAPVKNSARDAILWDSGKAPETNTIAAMTTEKSVIATPKTKTPAPASWAPLPPPTKAEAPMNLTPAGTAKMPPAPILADDHPMAPQPVVKPEPVKMADVAPAAPAPIVETIIEQAPVVAPADDKIVEGFGSNMPMALALRQIVPPTYRFSFGANVDPGQRVSWQGGHKWSEILQDMARQQGLTAEVAGNVVAIRSNGSPSSLSAAQDNMMEQVVMGTVTPSPVTPPPAPLAAPMPPKALATPAPVVEPMSLTRKTTETKTDEVILGKEIAMSDQAKQSAETAVMPAPAPTPLPPIADEDVIMPAPAKPLQADLAEVKPAPAPVVDTQSSGMTTVQEWTAHSGQSLRTILQEWSKQANVSLVWASSYDYPLQTDIRIQGMYPDAVRTLLAGFGKAQPKPIGRLHKNANVGAQPVLIVDTPRLING